MTQSNANYRLYDLIPHSTCFGHRFYIGRYLHTVTHADVYSIMSMNEAADVILEVKPRPYQLLPVQHPWEMRKSARHALKLNGLVDASKLNNDFAIGDILLRANKVIGDLERSNLKDEGSSPTTRPTDDHTVQLAQSRAESCVSITVGIKHTGFEARVYKLSGLAAHEYSRRSRAIKRLHSRTVLKTKWNDLQVVIYRTDAPRKVEPDQKTTTLREPTQHKEKANSARQQESRRLRQYDRRHSKVFQKAQEDYRGELTAALRTGKIEPPHGRNLAVVLDKKSFALLLLLHYAFGLTEKQRMHLPSDTKQTTAKFIESLKFKPIRIRGPRHMKELFDRMDCDLVVLKRLLAKLPSAEHLSNEQLEDYCHYHAKFEQGLEVWERIQDHLIKPSLAQHRIIQAGYRTVRLAIEFIIAAKHANLKRYRGVPTLVQRKTGEGPHLSKARPRKDTHRPDPYKVRSIDDCSGSRRISRRQRWLLFEEAMEEIQGKELGNMLSAQFNQKQKTVKS